jgi:hypothetical protein
MAPILLVFMYDPFLVKLCALCEGRADVYFILYEYPVPILIKTFFLPLNDIGLFAKICMYEFISSTSHCLD